MLTHDPAEPSWKRGYLAVIDRCVTAVTLVFSVSGLFARGIHLGLRSDGDSPCVGDVGAVLRGKTLNRQLVPGLDRIQLPALLHEDVGAAQLHLPIGCLSVV